MQRDKSLGVECHPLNKDNHFAQPTPSPPPGQHSVPSETPGPQNESKNTFFKYTLPDIDDHVLFWSTYDKEAGEADAELLEEWNKSIDILLIFAGLFSAINTAFIIESYKGLRPDPAEITNELLRLLIIHRNDNFTLTSEVLNPGNPHPSAIGTNCIFFASLSFSLGAAIAAVTVKQMLTQYSRKGSIKVLSEKCRDRQSKYMGLEAWHLGLVMDALPMSLQLSFFLFLTGVVQFLWSLERKVALMQLILSAAGIAVFLVTVFIGAIIPSSPFQTPFSKYVSRVLVLSKLGLQTVHQFLLHDPLDELFWEVYTMTLVPGFGIPITFNRIALPLSRLLTLFLQLILQPVFWIYGILTWLMKHTIRLVGVFGNALQEARSHDAASQGMRDTHRSDWDSQDICAAQAVIWLLEHSEHPNTTIAALDAALRLPSDLLLSLIIQRQGLDMRLFHFYSSLIPPHPRSFMSWVASWDDRAVICGMAILHIFTQPSFANPSIRSLRLGIGHQFIDYGYECVTEGDHALILRALVGFLFNPHLDPSWLSDILGKIQDPHYVAQLQVNLPDGRHSSLVSSITTAVPLCYLAFDVFTFIALTYSLDGFCKRTLPDVCNLARNVLTNSSSATVVSRIAITVGAGLWCIQVGTRRRRNPSWNLASSQNLKEVESLLITGTRAVDKGNMVIDNVALLLSLVDEESLEDEELIGCASLLHTLLTYTKNGFIQRSSLVSERPHFVDHLLLLSRSCRDDSSAQSTILEILCARWDTFMENHWEDFYLLVNHASTFPPLVTNLIRHLATYSGDEAFLQLFLSRDGLLSDPDRYSTLFPIQRPPFWRALRLSSTDPIILSNQIIVVLDCLAHSDGSRGASSSDEWIDQAECTVAFLTRMTETNTELEWPSYFSAGEMMALALKGTGYRQALQHLVPSWCGEFVILLWRGAHNWCAVGTLRDDWGDSAFFRKEIIDLMLEYHQFVKEKGYIGLDLNTLGGYLEQALRRVSRTQGDKQSLTQPDGYSNNVDEPNENHIDCSPAHNPEETSRKIVTDTKVVEDPEQEERHRRIIQALESLVFPSINS